MCCILVLLIGSVTVLFLGFILCVCVCVFGILEVKRKCKQFSFHEKKSCIEDLGNCDSAKKY